MNGNNSQTKEQFLSSLGNPRKVELANILFSDDADKANTALEAGFNLLLVKEMARDIRKNVEGCETFTVEGNGAVKKEEEINNPTVDQATEATNETTNENDTTTTEGNDPVDQSTTEENQVVDESENSANTPESESNQEVPGTTQA